MLINDVGDPTLGLGEMVLPLRPPMQSSTPLFGLAGMALPLRPAVISPAAESLFGIGEFSTSDKVKVASLALNGALLAFFIRSIGNESNTVWKVIGGIGVATSSMSVLATLGIIDLTKFFSPIRAG